MLARSLSWAHGDPINPEEDLGGQSGWGWKEEKIKSSFLDVVKFEVPEGHACGSRGVQ